MEFIGLALISLIMTIGGHYVKRPSAVITGGVAWVIMGIYALDQSTTTWDWWYALFFLACFAGIVCVIEAGFMQVKREEDYTREDELDEGEGQERIGRKRKPWFARKKNQQKAKPIVESKKQEPPKDQTTEIVRRNAARAAKARQERQQRRIDL